MSSSLRRRLSLVALSLPYSTFSAVAWSQVPVWPSAEREAQEQLTPPTLIDSVPANYPEAARAAGLSATVPLRLAIDEQGRVTEAVVVEPAGSGFDEAAREAALRFRFEPARRGAQPIASRIRYAFVFEPRAEDSSPATVTAPPSAARESSPSSPPAAAQLKPEAQPQPVNEGLLPPARAETLRRGVDVNVRGQLTEADELRSSAEAVSVVDMRRPREQAADLGEVLARNQGVIVRRSGGLGSDERFSLNGLYDEQIRFFIDGIPLDVGGWAFGIASVPVNLVERVEIYRGVVPVRFGADALGGAVNLVSDHDDVTKASGSYQIGSFGTHRATLAGRYRHLPTGLIVGAAAFADVAKNDFEVDVEIPDERGRPVPARVPRFHDGYRAIGGNVEAGIVDKPWAKRLMVRGFFADTQKELQHNIVMTVPYGEVRWGSSVYGLTARYAVELPHDVTLDVVAGYSKRATRFEDHGEWVYNWRGERIRERRVAGEIEAEPTDQIHWQHAASGRATARWQITAGHGLTLSTSPHLATRTGDERIQADPASRDALTADRRRLALVSGLEYQLDLLGDRVSNVLFIKDYYYRARSEEPLPGSIWKQRDAERHRQGVGDSLRLRFTPWLYAKASYEYATRLPGPDELFGDGVLIQANLDLEPEISHNANLGPTLDLRRTPFGDFSAEVNAFFRDSDRLVVLLGNDRFFSYQNVYRARAFGLENAATWTSPKRYVSLEGGVTWLDLRNAGSEGTFGDFEGDRIPNRPYLTASWGGRLRFGGFPDADDALQPYYSGRYVHEFYRGWESQGLREFKQIVDAQMVHSLGLTWSLTEGWGRITTSVEADNVTGAQVFDNYGVERPGRAFYLKVAADL